jgi:RNA polymerase sigma-70 factor (ECF subfamily)
MASRAKDQDDFTRDRVSIMTAPDPDDQDRQDMARLAAGHDSALNELMARHDERLFHYLLRLAQSDTEAADIAEETFVRIYQNREKFRSRNKFSTWLYTIATNLARDLHRHRTRHPQVSLDAELQNFTEILPSGKPGPGETVQAAETVSVVRQAIAALPEELRLPLVLAEYEDKSHAEIALILQCSAKAVEMRIYRARQELRVRLAPYFEK